MTSVEAITELRQIVDEILSIASKKCLRGDKWIKYTINGWRAAMRVDREVDNFEVKPSETLITRYTFTIGDGCFEVAQSHQRLTTKYTSKHLNGDLPDIALADPQCFDKTAQYIVDMLRFAEKHHFYFLSSVNRSV